jgi:hypothetical protein
MKNLVQMRFWNSSNEFGDQPGLLRFARNDGSDTLWGEESLGIRF